MKFLVHRALGLLSGVVLSSVGWLPFLHVSPEAGSTVHQIASARELKIPRDSTGDSGTHAEENDEQVEKALATLNQKVNLLKKGRQLLSTVADYTTLLEKQEVVQGRLLELQEIQMKCRHQPFSVYLNWQTGDTGREVIYVEGRNQGKMIAHDGGWKSRIPAFSLSPDCSLAMKDSRYPITSAGIAVLLDEMLAMHEQDLERQTVASCERLENQLFEGRPCSVFITKYKSPAVSPQYRKSITFIDQEWNLPCCSRHFEWPAKSPAEDGDEVDESTLVEFYSFKNIQFNQRLTDHDFDRTNPDYRFH